MTLYQYFLSHDFSRHTIQDNTGTSIQSNSMNLLCVYCSSSNEVAVDYHRHAQKLGQQIADKQWGLVYGGGKSGLMGAVAQGVKQAGGHVVGIIPHFMIERELAFKEANELLTVETMAERKLAMIERATAFVALPGGIGTLEEISEVITLKYLGKLNKPIIFYNQNGFYDDLLKFFERMASERFRKMEGIYSVANTFEEIWPLIDSVTTYKTAW